MPARRVPAVVVLVLALLSPFLQSTAQAATTPLPKSMAAAGDSITRAYDVGWCCVLRDAPRYSWSTGWDSALRSHYRRILAVQPGISGNAYNDAVSGAKSADLPRQLTLAASQGADYVTVEIGANDVCTSTASRMTSVSSFQTNVRSALASYTSARPQGRVLMASIPNVYRLWQLFRYDASARSTWEAFGICQSMLDIWATESTRQAVLTREKAFNDVLAKVCAEFRQCRWDGYAVFNFSFSRSDVSTVDYFHPSVSGQNKLAAVTWAAGYWPEVV